MSMPSYQLQCDRCDYSASSTLIWGYFEYETDKGRLAVGRTLGWCKSCQGFQPIESFGCVDEEDLMEAITELEASLQAGFWRRFWRLFGFYTRHDQWSLKTLRENIQSLVLASRRSGKECCLSCGSMDHLPFDDSMPLDEYLTYTGTQPTRFIHPDCGGSIQLKGIGLRLAMAFRTTKVYSTEGELLREEER